jgi:hypothetical protein
MALNTEGFGYLRTFVQDALTAGNSVRVPLNEDDIDRIGFINVLDVVNNSSEIIDVYLDGNTNKSIRVLGGTSKQLNGTRFQSLVLKNISGTDTEDGEILVAVQKAFDRAEEFEIKKLI